MLKSFTCEENTYFHNFQMDYILVYFLLVTSANRIPFSINTGRFSQLLSILVERYMTEKVHSSM